MTTRRILIFLGQAPFFVAVVCWVLYSIDPKSVLFGYHTGLVMWVAGALALLIWLIAFFRTKGIAGFLFLVTVVSGSFYVGALPVPAPLAFLSSMNMLVIAGFALILTAWAIIWG